MDADGGRAPAPPGGDPNTKTLRIELTPLEWRALRAWAAQEMSGVEAIVVSILRRELERRPRQEL